MKEKVKQEVIERLKFYKEYAGLGNGTVIVSKVDLEKVLNEVDRLQQENKELRKGQQSLMQSRRKWKDRYYKLKENSIPKSVIQDKIEELANLEHERWAKWKI